MMNRFFRMIAENEEETQYKKPAMEVSKKYLVNMQILLCFMYFKYEDVGNEDFLNMGDYSDFVGQNKKVDDFS